MNCRVCGSTELAAVLALGEQPWANHFLTPEQVGKEPKYPLTVCHCARCKTAQLDFTVKKEIMFGEHTYRSGVTRSLREHFLETAKGVDARFFSGAAKKSVLDIGSNDGAQLLQYKSLGWETLGVESAKGIAAIAESAGVPTLNAYFNEQTARGLGRRFDVVSASGVFFHLEELHSAAEGVRLALAEDGVFVVQFLYMKRIVENLAFDQIYHEHLLYYNLRTIEALLERHGLGLFDAYLSPIHGGSIVGLAGHRARRPVSQRLLAMRAEEDRAGANERAYYEAFAGRVSGKRLEERAYLREQSEAGRVIWGLGAPVKGNTLLNYLGVGPETIPVLVEKNELRRGLYAPGSHIPVKLESELQGRPDVYYVLAWNFKDEILANHKAQLEAGVEFHFPVDPSKEAAR